MLPLVLFLPLVSGAALNSTAAPNSTTTTPTPSLLCNCTADSFYCPTSGRCDAVTMAHRLRLELTTWQSKMQNLLEFPGNYIRTTARKRARLR